MESEIMEDNGGQQEITLRMPQPEKIIRGDALVDAIRKLLKDNDNGRDRTFWVDKALVFLQIRDKIPQRLIDDKYYLLCLAEPWLRAAAERGVRFEEDEGLRAAAGQNLFESLLHVSPWHRWFTAKVAAENGHKRMVLDLIQGHNPWEDKYLTKEVYLWFYIIWRFLVVESGPPQTDNLQLWNSMAVKGKSDRDGEWTFLHFAAAKGDLACVEVLLAGHVVVDDGHTYHVDLDGRTKPEGYTALHLASYHDNAAIVDLLLKDGAKVDQPDKEGRMPLHLASVRGCLASVNALLEHAKDHSIIMEELKDGNGMTALHLAACRGETEVVGKLMTFTQNPNQKCSQDLLHEKFFIAHSLSRKRDETVRSYRFYDKTVRSYQVWDETVRSYRFWDLEASSSQHAIFQSQPEYRLKSQVWSPGGFTALHFAVVYGNADTVREILQHGKRGTVREIVQHGERGTVREMLSTTQDNLGLTPADWAEVVDLKGKIGRVIQCSERSKAQPILPADGHEERSLMQLFPGSCRKVTSCSNFGKANKHYEEVKEAEGERLRLQWTVDIGEAVVAKEWGEARWLVRQGVKDKIKVDDVIWEHLQWAMSRRIAVIRRPLIERMVVELVEGEAFSNSSSTMQRCLMWAMEQEMVELVEAIVKDAGKNKCELLSVARGCEEHIKKSPLETATDMGGELGSQLVAVMEQREDVQRRLYEDRQVYVDYANTILVAAVLIAALAFQGWVQSPQGYAAVSPAADAKGMMGMLVFARCNTLGFVLSMGAVIAGAVGAMPLRSGQFVKFREKSSRAAATASLLMVASVASEVVGFAVAVASDVKPQYRKEMLVSTRFGTTIVFLLSAWFLIRLNELQPLLDLLLHALPKTLLLPIDLIKTLLHSLSLSEFFHTRSFQLLVFNPLYLYVFHPFHVHVFQPFKSYFPTRSLSRPFRPLLFDVEVKVRRLQRRIERFCYDVDTKVKELQQAPAPAPGPIPLHD